MTPLAQNFTDQSGTIASNLAKGTREIRFAPGYHRLAKPIGIPHGTRFVGHKAVLDFAHSDWAFLLSGDFHLDGVELIHRDDVNPMLATGIAGDPHISFDRVTCGVRTTVQNIKTKGATNSTFHASSMWKDATINRCTFNADCYIGGSTQFTNNTMRGRLIANAEVGGLNKALVQGVRWEPFATYINLDECLLFETCDVVDSLFDGLRFGSGGVTLLEWWAIDAAGNSTAHKCTGNIFRNIISDGPTCIGLRFIGGEVDGNTIQNVSLHRVMFPILLEPGCKANKLEYIYVIGSEPVIPQGGFEHLVWWNATRFHERFIIRDDGEATKVSWMYVEGAKGIKASNRRERITQLSEN